MATALSAANLLCRDSVLRKGTAAIGVVVYAGNETKVRVRNARPHAKRGFADAAASRAIVAMLCLQLVICVVAAASAGRMWGRWGTRMPKYLDPHPVNGAAAEGGPLEFLYTVVSWMLLNGNLVPISLYGARGATLR